MANLDTPQGAAAYAEEWDEYMGDIQSALQASSGLEREKLAAQMKDAAAGRENAYKIAQLQASTTRYGIDIQRKTALDQLKENARQFDARHALEKEQFAFEKEKFGKEFGLKYADRATDYLSTPDRFAQGMDFRMMADRALQGQGPQPYGSGVEFQPKTPEDFARLASYGTQPSPASGAWSPHGPAAPVTPAAGGFIPEPMLGTEPGQGGGGHSERAPTPGQPVSTQPVNEGGGGGTDPRVKVLTAMMKEMPPSTTPGYDANDLAVMNAAKALYSTNLLPGTLQRMRPDQKAIYSSFIKRSGRSWNDYQDDVAGYAPNQRSVRAA